MIFAYTYIFCDGASHWCLFLFLLRQQCCEFLTLVTRLDMFEFTPFWINVRITHGLVHSTIEINAMSRHLCSVVHSFKQTNKGRCNEHRQFLGNFKCATPFLCIKCKSNCFEGANTSRTSRNGMKKKKNKRKTVVQTHHVNENVFNNIFVPYAFSFSLRLPEFGVCAIVRNRQPQNKNANQNRKKEEIHTRNPHSI